MRQRYFLACCWLLICGFAFQGDAQASLMKPLNGKRVLLLLSYDPLFPSSRKIIDGVTQTLAQDKIPVQVHYLHSKSVWSNGYRDLLASFYLDPNNTNWLEFDLVITADDNAFSFIKQHRLTLFGDIPWIFLGVNDEAKVAWAETQPFVTGLYEAPSFTETLTLAASLFPDYSRIHVISDATPSGSADYQKLASLYADMAVKPRLHSLSLRERSWTKLGYELRNLPADDPLLLLSAYKDNLNHRKQFDESLQFIRQNANGPIFHMWEHGLGEGVLGGVMINPQRHAIKAAEYALNVLKGGDIQTLPVLWQSPNLAEFDQHQLDRFKIATQSLPKQRSVINHQPSLLESYYTELLFLFIVGVVLMLFTITLMLENYRHKRLEKRLRIEQATLTNLNNNTPDLVFYKNLKGVYKACNHAFEQFIGKTKDEIIGYTDNELLAANQAPLCHEQESWLKEPHILRRSSQWVSYNNGKRVYLDLLKFPNRDDDGNIIGLVGIARDITQIHEKEAQNRLLAKIFDCAEEGMLICDRRGRIIDVNPAFSRLTGFRRRAALHQRLRQVLPQSARSTYRELRSQLLLNQGWQGEIDLLKADGALLHAWFIASPVPNDGDEQRALSYIGTFSDIGELKQTRDNLNYLAHHDQLTGMPNRLQLTSQLQYAIDSAKRLQHQLAVLYIDLDRFKHINDSIGHQFGDKVLCHVGEQISNHLRGNDIAARLGGDEFVVVLNPITNLEQVSLVIDKLFHIIQQPLILDNHPINLQASIGVSLYPEDGTTPDILIKHADSALYEAKACGRNTYRFYTAALTQKAVERMELEHQLAHAIKAEQLEVYFQPIVKMVDNTPFKAEALIRWQHPDKGMIPPDKFIPIAEDTGCIMQITDLVLDTCCKQMVKWRREHWPIQRISVNISRIELSQTNIAKRVIQVLERTGCPPQSLVIEITEGTMMSLDTQAIDRLKQLRALGVFISIDDFGTGLSSLGNLRNLPLTELKIDRSFIIDMLESNKNAELVRLVIEFARVMALEVVAEGVETQEQAELLKRLQCDYAQGYLYSKPLPLEAFQQQLALESY